MNLKIDSIDEIKWKREAQFMDDLQSHNWIEFFHRWFHFGSYEDVYDDVIEYFTKVKYPMGVLTYHDFDDVSGTPEEDNRNVFVHCSTVRDLQIVDAIASKKLDYITLQKSLIVLRMVICIVNLDKWRVNNG